MVSVLSLSVGFYTSIYTFTVYLLKIGFKKKKCLDYHISCSRFREAQIMVILGWYCFRIYSFSVLLCPRNGLKTVKYARIILTIDRKMIWEKWSGHLSYLFLLLFLILSILCFLNFPQDALISASIWLWVQEENPIYATK